jgi:hypothetical protein
MTVLPLTGFDSPTETLSGTASAPCNGEPPLSPKAPPMGFSTPPANENQRFGTMPGFHPRRQPSTAFLRPSRDNLTGSCELVSSRCRSWGSHPPELFPPAELYRARHPAIPSRRFSEGSEEPSAAPPGHFVLRESVTDPGVLHPSSARCSPGLSRSHGIRRFRLGAPPDVPSAHGLHILGLLARPRC